MERIKLAEKIISTCREMNASGLNQGTSGNVSARYTGGMLITPSGIAYSKMTPDMIVFVDDKGKPEAGKIPSSEWLIHLACYKARPELNAVIHTHAVNSTAVAIHNHSIPAIHYMVAVSGTDHISCIPIIPLAVLNWPTVYLKESEKVSPADAAPRYAGHGRHAGKDVVAGG